MGEPGVHRKCAVAISPRGGIKDQPATLIGSIGNGEMILARAGLGHRFDFAGADKRGDPGFRHFGVLGSVDHVAVVVAKVDQVLQIRLFHIWQDAGLGRPGTAPQAERRR